MRYLNVLLFLLLIFIWPACDKVKSLTQFHMDYNETVTIPSSSGINLPFNLYSPEVETNSEATFAIHDTRKDLVSEVFLEKTELSVKSPPDRNFSFLKSIAVFIDAEGMSEKKIAWQDDIDSQASTIQLITTKENIRDYIVQEAFNLRVNTVTKEFITSDYDINIYTLLFVNARLI